MVCRRSWFGTLCIYVESGSMKRIAYSVSPFIVPFSFRRTFTYRHIVVVPDSVFKSPSYSLHIRTEAVARPIPNPDGDQGCRAFRKKDLEGTSRPVDPKYASSQFSYVSLSRSDSESLL